MAEETRNFIAGEWVEGESAIENRNPSDLSDLIGHYAQASGDQLDSALDAGQARADRMGQERP